MELLIFLIIIINIVRVVKKNKSSQSAPKPNNQPSSAAKPTDKYQLYKRFIERDRYSDLEKLGHELGLSKYQVAQDIRTLQKKGHFKTVTLDDRNYKLYYPASSKAASNTSAARPEEPDLTYVQPSDPYRPDRNAGKRHEDWMELPPHTQAVKCRYCGAGNAVPIGRRSKYTCYFCREEL